MLRIAHCADLHLRRDRLEEGLASIKSLEEHCRENGVELIIISGDLWDAPIQNTTAFATVVEAIRSLAYFAPIAMVYGTPSHDVEGSLEVFETLDASHNITILRPGVPYYLGSLHVNPVGKVPGEKMRALLLGVPEPSKKWLLAGQEVVGKEAAEAAVRSSMQALFLGLGGLRKQYPDLPCILLYHGQVVGARTGTGYTAGSGIAVSRDDLASVGADYIALGDIHEPQQIPGLPAYYPGSVYPLNWGETHKAGFNYVTLRALALDPLFYPTGFTTAVERVDFPHPQKMKLAITSGVPWAASECMGRMAWAEITATKEEAARIDIDAILGTMFSFGALPGSRVTLNILPTETVRAGEIAGKKRLRDKVALWAENSGKTLAESVLAKADEIEGAAAGGVAGKGGAIRLTKLVLRGAIGIWKNSKRDEVELDFERYGEGVVALVGENGSGKTTLIENCHPWPCMLTRDGTLKDHFRLRDSARELHFTDEATGDQYKALIQINAATASGGAEYYLYKNGAPLPGINGRKEPYEQAVNELFGSLSLYLKSAFTSQRPSKYSPDFSDATKGQRKDLMAELSGLDYLDAYAAIAKGRAEAIEAEVQAKRAEITVLEGLIAERPAKEAERDELKKRHEAQKAEVARLVKDGLAAREASNAAEKAAEAQRALETEAAELAKKIVLLDQEKAGIERAAAEMRGLIEHRAEYEATIARHEELKKKEEALHAEQTRILRERERITLEHRNSTQAVRDAEQALKTEQTRIDGFRAECREEIAVLRQKTEALRERLQDKLEDTCPTCGQELPADTLESLRAKRDEDAAKKAEIEEKLVAEEVKLLRLQSESEAVGYKMKALVWPPDPVLPEFDAAELAKVTRESASINVAGIRASLAKADEAGVRIQEGAKRLEAVEDQRTEAAEAYLAAKGKIDPEIPKAAVEAKGKLEDLQGRYTAAAGTLASLTTSIEHAERSLAEIAAKAQNVETSKRQIEAQELEAAEWRTLQEACGQNGIQALELDALCPGIAAVANELLKAAYGPRYQIEFSTTRIGGKGSKTKQIEDFLIYIIDAETGMQQEISTLSGGESVWIKRAIYDSFAVVRGRNTGIRFLTNFQDEADGALDPAAREAYIRMLEAAHASAGRYQTVIITHSREVQDMIGQKILVADLAARIAEESVA